MHPVPGVEESDHLVAVDPLADADGGPDDGVEARAVATSGEYSYAHASDRTLRHRLPAAKRVAGGWVSGTFAVRDRRLCDRPRRGHHGVRSRAVFADGRESIASYREFTQLFPEPGRVEHDAVEIWQAMLLTLGEVVAEVDGAVGADNIAAIGITNQRETVLAWNRSTGEPYGTAIVWQDRRTAQRCDELTAAGALPMVRERTGLVLDPYFSGTKIEWLLTERDIPVDSDLAIGTIDAWLIWNLTGGTVFATDVSNASRTMLCDIRSRQWDRELCELLHVPIACLPEIVPSSGRIGVTASLDGVPAGHSDQRCGGRPAGGAVRPGLCAAGDGEEHLRHRFVRPAQRR